MKTVVIGDLHGDWQGLIAILRATGAIDVDERRLPETKVLQLGDLIHGGGRPLREGVDDRRCAELALDLCDVVLIGNHELPHIWPEAEFPRFNGLGTPSMATLHCLDRLWRDGRLVPACAHDGWLLTHAGVAYPYAWGYTDAEEAAKALRNLFVLRLEKHSRLGCFDAVGRRRGGSESRGGVFWCDWGELTDGEQTAIPQIVGHTPQVDGYARNGNLWCVDAGAALSGLVSALIQDEPGGEWRPVVVESETGQML